MLDAPLTFGGIQHENLGSFRDGWIAFHPKTNAGVEPALVRHQMHHLRTHDELSVHVAKPRLQGPLERKMRERRIVRRAQSPPAQPDTMEKQVSAWSIS